MSEEEAKRRKELGPTPSSTCTDDVLIDWIEGMEVFNDTTPIGERDGDWQTVPIMDTEFASAAGMNDCGFTFDQIADCMTYMGIKPYRSSEF